MKFDELIAVHIPNWQPKTVFEIGACDGRDSLALAAVFPMAEIYAFEPNPKTIPESEANAAKNPRVHLTPMAVSEVDGFVTFYQSMTDNAGYSSTFKPSGKYDIVEPMPVKQLVVPSIRVDTFLDRMNIASVDAMWLDAQGGELAILKSMGNHIGSVRAVWTEFCYDELYTGQPLFEDLKTFLESHGLKFIWKQDVYQDTNGKWWWGDAFFARI